MFGGDNEQNVTPAQLAEMSLLEKRIMKFLSIVATT